MVQKNRRKAKNLFASRTIQLGLLFIVITGVLTSCLLSVAVFAFFAPVTEPASLAGSTLSAWYSLTLFFRNTSALIFLTICGVGTILLFVAIMSCMHRLSGPIHRFEMVLRKMAEKKLTESITLREGDDGQELASTINHLNMTLTEDVRNIRKHTNAIQNLTNHLNAMGSANLSAEDVDSIVAAIQANNMAIKKINSLYILTEGKRKSR